MLTKKILPLAPEIISKIAAGEVIERPAYAVKELVENAIDAGADKISIVLENGGLKKIAVTDNGIGMNKEDLEESFKLHTTSKIATIDELEKIASFGFRGEALASIAAVSNLTLQSRIKGSIAGTKIELINGKIHDIAPIGMPVGTVITVSDLFHSVPARMKFLKTPATEFRHILQILTNLVFANPQIHFYLAHNKKIIFDLPKTKDPQERVRFFLGAKVFNNLLPVDYQSDFVTISGFISKPHLSIALNNKQYFFINKRSINNQLIENAGKDGYGTLMPLKAKPVLILFLSLPYELVDVNVHPRKEKVNLANQQMVYEAIVKAVNETLVSSNLTFYAPSLSITKSFAGRVIKEKEIPWDIRQNAEIKNFSEIVQLHNLYLVSQTKFGIAFIDQHAAHERILYEQFLKAFEKQQKTLGLYHFTSPQVIEVTLSEKELMLENLSVFEKLGFALELFKDNVFLLSTVPLILQDRDSQELIAEMLENLEQDKKPKIADNLSHKMLSFLACRAAIKAGEKLTKKQAKELVEKLQKTNNNATCPHGRPTKIIVDLDQLHRMFKRK